MMFIVPIVLETSRENLPFVLKVIRDTEKAEHFGVEFIVTGFGNTLPVPVESEDSFRRQLQNMQE